jgi:hypothetical protein
MRLSKRQAGYRIRLAGSDGLRKPGFSIVRTREERSDSMYRIVSRPAAAAA